MRVELDTNEDGRVDKWETYEDGAIKTAEFDEDGDGRRDRRLTYNDAALELIESEPDAVRPLHRNGWSCNDRPPRASSSPAIAASPGRPSSAGWRGSRTSRS